MGALLAAFLPGALGGAQLAAILFYLNPHLPFDFVTLAVGIGYYGGLIGLVGALILAIAARFDGAKLRQWLPSSVTITLLLSALGYWFHPSYLGYYLPPGINSRLLKAAVSISLIVIICFYSILWRGRQRRPFTRRDLLFFSLMAALSISVVVERREAFRPREISQRPTALEKGQQPLLLVVGIESATLDAILPLAEQGQLPFFNRMLQEGASARVAPLRPERRLPQWATLSTGKLPYKHGVVDRAIYRTSALDKLSLRLLPVAISFATWGVAESRPVDRRDLLTLPFWQILARLKVQVATIDWPLTAPTREGEWSVTDRFFASGADPAFAAPAALAERARLFDSLIEDLDPDLVARFGKPSPPSILAPLAGDQWRKDLSFYLLDPERDLGALFVLLPGLAKASEESFADFAAVQFEGEDEPATVASSLRLRAYYSELDDFLGRLWASQNRAKRLIVVSPQGVDAESLWLRLARLVFRRSLLEGSIESAADGVFFFLGDGFQAGARVRQAEVVDLVPTLLYLQGYPIARDLDGSILTNVFTQEFLATQPLTFVPSYETLAEAELRRAN